MNVFKRGRKAKDQPEIYASRTDGAPSLPVKHSKTLRRKNKHVEEDKPVLDLTTVLPDSNEFRTSLLMPGLSARFSMLREQDDPNTKIGKASDDSVLFPKRASRLNLFGHNASALADISEVESIRSSFKPPFADRERSNSFGDGYDSDSGSIMTRARPGEGNNLFGGRQRFYRIPTGSTRTLVEGEGTVGGKHVYEHDVALSLFQQYRMKERGRRTSDEENRDPQNIDADDSDTVQSPTTGSAFSKNRGTQSSTASGRSNLRTSTAATSVASESPQIGSNTTGSFSSKPGNDMGSRNGDSPTIAPTNFRKFREETSRPARQLSHSKSAANIRDKSQRAGIMYPAGTFRAMSPPPPHPASAGAMQPLDFGFGDRKNSPGPSRAANESPTPTHPASDNVLASSVQPNDRGKATALGLFNKPAKEFDEKQYLQRQLQMHEGRSSPLQPYSRTASREEHRNPSSGHQTNPSPTHTERTSTPQIPPVPESSAAAIVGSQRESGASNASSGRGTPPNRPRSKSSASTTAKDNVKARVESLIRRQNAELTALEDEKLGLTQPQTSGSAFNQAKDHGGTFFDNDDESSTDEDQAFSDARESKSSSVRLPDGDIHPAFRTSLAPSTQSRNSNFSRSRTNIDDSSDRLNIPVTQSSKVSAETSGASGPIGLSGLIRTHLRHDSDKSSIYPPPSPQFQYLATAESAHQDSFDIEPESSSQEHGTDEREPTHKRGESTATTKERREFDAELAERRRKIQEGLKGITERDRSSSPAGPLRGREHTMQAFITAQNEIQPKALRTLGIEQVTSDALMTAARASEDESIRPNYTRKGSAASTREENERIYSSQAQTSGFSKQRSTTAGSSRSTTPSSIRLNRSRSNSAAGDQPRSRPRYSDDNNQPMPGAFMRSNPQSPQAQAQENLAKIRDLSSSSAGNRGHVTSPTSDLDTNVSRFSPRPSPISPMSQTTMESSRSAAQPYQMNGRTTPTSLGRNSPFGSRKRSGTRTQISEPTFISSTASVPLIPLPQAPMSPEAPPLPEMNPRRRGTHGDRQRPAMNIAGTSGQPLDSVPASPRFPNYDVQQIMSESEHTTKGFPKLRKSSSEGGSMAAKARHQAFVADLKREKSRTPVTPVFPNRSATTLAMNQDGAMF